MSSSLDKDAMVLKDGPGTAQNVPVKNASGSSVGVKAEDCKKDDIRPPSSEFNFKAETEKLMLSWTKTCYEEGALLELEERLIRRLAGQCNLSLEQGPYRKAPPS